MDSNIVISKMNGDDIDEVSKIGYETTELHAGTSSPQFFDQETLKGWIDDPNGITFVAKIDNKLIGFVLASYSEGPRDGYLQEIVILKQFRNMGIGKKLVKLVSEKIIEKGGDHLFMIVQDSNENMLAFIKQQGFEIGSKFLYVDKMLD